MSEKTYAYNTRKQRNSITRTPPKITSVTARYQLEGDSRAPYFFICAGHNKYDTGAVANGFIEAELTIELRDLIVEELRKLTQNVVVDDDFGSLRDTVNWLYERTIEGDLVFDIHFNASDKASATGVEALIPNLHNPHEAKLADALAALVSVNLSIPNRGVKTEAESERKKLAMMTPNGNNVLLEVCFITNSGDMASYLSKKVELSKVIARILFAT